MPREQIIFPRVRELLAAPDLPDHRPMPPTPIPHVCWHGSAPDGWVQVMFECDREYLEQFLAELPRDQQTIEVHSEVLNRAESNKMVRVLRRARDAAYGKDE